MPSIVNHSDPFDKTYTPIDDIQRALINDIKSAAAELYELMLRTDREYDARCGHLARTRLEESVMWAVKGVTHCEPVGHG